MPEGTDLFEIMRTMLKTLLQPRSEISRMAPRLLTIKINPEKIRDVIGKGGAVIRGLTEETGCVIDIGEDGTITITYGLDANSRIVDETLVVQPFTNNNGDVAWRCGNSAQPEGTTENSQPDGSGIDSIAGTSTVLDKHVPASCRAGFGS